MRSIVMSMSVCVSTHITRKPHKIFVHVVYGPDSVLLWRRCDMLCTSGFVDDITFSHKGPMMRHVAYIPKRR